MTTLKNVAVAGAGGNLGPAILKALLESGKFNVTVLSRQESQASFPSSVKVAKVNFDSVDSLKAALQGQDAVVSVLGTEAVGNQFKLIDAAIAAGVKRFLPSEFGCDLQNQKSRKLPVFAIKAKVEDYIVEKAKENPDFTYTFVYTNAFLDWGLELSFFFDWKDFKPTIYNGGDQLFSATTLSSIGTAVVGVLTHPEKTANRGVRIADIDISQNQLLAIAKKYRPGKTWEPVHADITKVAAESDERLAKGLLDAQTFIPYILQVLFDKGYGGKYENLDNELLGVKGLDEEELEKIFKPILTAA